MKQPISNIIQNTKYALCIGVFDPKTRVFQFIPIGHGALYPHTLRFDRDGILWFTLAMSNQLGRYDPRSGQMVLC